MSNKITKSDHLKHLKSRALNDAELLKNGAEYVEHEDGKVNLIVTDTQRKLAATDLMGYEMEEDVSSDYNTVEKNLDWYGLLETAEDGRKFYTADYDGTAEAGGKGYNFMGKKFRMPTLPEILKGLTPDQIKLYNEYRGKGLKPYLQLTPIAVKIRTLAGKFDRKMKNNTFISEMDERKLIYEPQTVEASADGQELIVKNGLTKSQLIDKYEGWMVRIICRKTESDKGLGSPTIGRQASQYMKSSMKRGESGMSYEDYLMLQMNALAGDYPKPLDQEVWSLLPGSSSTEGVPAGSWAHDRVILDRMHSDQQNAQVGIRHSFLVQLK